MIDKKEILKQIKHELAHCMALYGDQPEYLITKLETLTFEWFSRGINYDKSDSQ